MDRNKYVVQCRKTLGVALRKESVDRNTGGLKVISFFTTSLSARRAWIEILEYLRSAYYVFVALRKESVDRNVFLTLTVRNVPIVALRKESVDRNSNTTREPTEAISRSPQGERG